MRTDARKTRQRAHLLARPPSARRGGVPRARGVRAGAMFSRLADKFKRKGQEEKFEVTLRISTLSPWPSTGKFKRLCVRWERGSKVRAFAGRRSAAEGRACLCAQTHAVAQCGARGVPRAGSLGRAGGVPARRAGR